MSALSHAREIGVNMYKERYEKVQKIRNEQISKCKLLTQNFINNLETQLNDCNSSLIKRIGQDMGNNQIYTKLSADDVKLTQADLLELQMCGNFKSDVSSIFKNKYNEHVIVEINDDSPTGPPQQYIKFQTQSHENSLIK